MGYPIERGAFGPQALLGSNTRFLADLSTPIIPSIAQQPYWAPTLHRGHQPETRLPFTYPDDDPIARILSDADLRLAWDLAERRANGFRLRRNLRTKYGEFARHSENNPFLSQHNHEHGRRVEAHAQALLGNIPEIRAVSLPSYLIDAAALFPYLHDSEQLDTEQRNVDTKKRLEGKATDQEIIDSRDGSNTNDKLPPKHAHGPAGALKILAQTREYADAAGISYQEARKITGAAALMIMVQEEPAFVMQALAGREVLPGEQRGEVLLDAFENNRLDLTKLSVDQLIKIVITKKAKKGFTETTQFGLHPLFEHEYAGELAALVGDLSPLIPHFSEDQDRAGLDILTQVTIFADVFDMIMPAEPAITRKLGVEKSLYRRFFPSGVTFDKLFPDITGARGNFPEETDSDITRALWEFDHPLAINDSGIIAQSEYVQNLIGRTVIKGALAFKEVGVDLMSGSFSALARIFDRRIASVKEKLERKDIDTSNNSRIDALYLDRDALIAKLHSKFFRDDQPRYSQMDILQFSTIMDRMLVHLQRKHGISDQQVEVLRAELHTGSNPEMPYEAYDSVSLDTSAAKTIYPAV